MFGFISLLVEFSGYWLQIFKASMKDYYLSGTYPIPVIQNAPASVKNSSWIYSYSHLFKFYSKFIFAHSLMQDICYPHLFRIPPKT